MYLFDNTNACRLLFPQVVFSILTECNTLDLNVNKQYAFSLIVLASFYGWQCTTTYGSEHNAAVSKTYIADQVVAGARQNE